ncbi:MAG: hypothetical protein A2945_03775 [Candidatus Liptonbacteria bacterium RIFCSPLOWO2_01_FULL_52_25]|uniref:Ubiquitin-like domain-containing protein n=1 Tax=Candidatus Liptonbacteria bacterium RIFCSPLOWO2_01_FULL_52_25 TaxID=1798650 RepID=A0A1G2CGA6_9BACT|nr:MAG: hypothetical protein A2945_03775 [Candidatus Liptonbacteria bacterium RIFCSPLOWO2_01_FULL_52_25]
MKEQEKNRSRQDGEGQPESDMIEYSVTIQHRHFGEKISLPRNATLADLLAEVQKQHGVAVEEYQVRLNDRQIESDKEGKLKENPILTENGVLILTTKIVGGA